MKAVKFSAESELESVAAALFLPAWSQSALKLKLKLKLLKLSVSVQVIGIETEIAQCFVSLEFAA